MGWREFRWLGLWIGVALVLALAGSTIAGSMNGERSCTSFAVSSPRGIYLADSEDGSSGHPGIEDPESLAAFFWPSTESTFGRMHIGWLWQRQHHSYQTGMNDQGLAYSATAVPHVEIDSHPERPYSWNDDPFWDTMLARAATVAEAVGIAESFDYTEGLWFQTMVADASGATAVIGPGSDGELAVSWKSDGDAFMVASTINVATGASEGGDSQERFDTATAMLADAASQNKLDEGTVAEVLQAVSRQNWYTLFNLNTYTVYSDFFDLEERTVWVWYLSNFDEVVRFDLDEELLKGAHHVMLIDLFSDTTVQSALTQFNDTGRSGYIAMFGVFAGVLVATAALWRSVRRFVRYRRPQTMR